jgi:AcrR family transcriptional regulator
MNKNKIIQTSTALFAAYGIKTVDMKRVAKEAHVSEEALETEFKGKEQLIEDCLKNEIERLETTFSEVVSYAQSSLERFVDTVSAIFNGLSGFCPAFFKDLKAYPSAQKCLNLFRERFLDMSIGYFVDCGKDGLFSPEFCNESTAAICVEQISSLEYKYQSKMLRLFLQGISTEKGIKELNRINKESNLFINN